MSNQPKKETDGHETCEIRKEYKHYVLRVNGERKMVLPVDIEPLLEELYDPFDEKIDTVSSPSEASIDEFLRNNQLGSMREWREHVDLIVADLPPNDRQTLPPRPRDPDPVVGQQFKIAHGYMIELLKGPQSADELRQMFEETAALYKEHVALVESWSEYEHDNSFRRAKATFAVHHRLKKHNYHGLYYKCLRFFRAIRRFIVSLFVKQTDEDEEIRPLFADCDEEDEIELPRRTYLCGLIKGPRRFFPAPTF